MTLTLSAAIDATQNQVQLSGDLDAQPGDIFRLDDEVVTFGGHLALDRQHGVSMSLVSFGRGQEGTTASTHILGTPLYGSVSAVASANVTVTPQPFVEGFGPTSLQSYVATAGISLLSTTNVNIDGEVSVNITTPNGGSVGSTTTGAFLSGSGDDLGHIETTATEIHMLYTTDADGDVAGVTADAAGTHILNYIPPTSDPGVAGALWNDTGTLKVSTG